MNNEPASVSDEVQKRLCRPGQGAASCSFLVIHNGWRCAKGSDLEPLILSRRANLSMKAMGDNCSGPPDFAPEGSR